MKNKNTKLINYLKFLILKKTVPKTCCYNYSLQYPKENFYVLRKFTASHAFIWLFYHTEKYILSFSFLVIIKRHFSIFITNYVNKISQNFFFMLNNLKVIIIDQSPMIRTLLFLLLLELLDQWFEPLIA